jgi:hypothetical protein
MPGETIIALTLLRPKSGLQICTSKKKIILKAADLTAYYGDAGQKGHKLSKEMQNLISIEEVSLGN